MEFRGQEVPFEAHATLFAMHVLYERAGLSNDEIVRRLGDAIVRAARRPDFVRAITEEHDALVLNGVSGDVVPRGILHA